MCASISQPVFVMGSSLVVTGLQHSYTNERSCVTGRSVYSGECAVASACTCFLTWSYMCQDQRVLGGRARALLQPYLSVCHAPGPGDNETMERRRLRSEQRGERVDRTWFACSFGSYIHGTVHERVPGISEDGFQAPSFENRLLVTAPWRTCFSVEARPRSRRNALCVGLERFVKRRNVYSRCKRSITQVLTIVFC